MSAPSIARRSSTPMMNRSASPRATSPSLRKAHCVCAPDRDAGWRSCQGFYPAEDYHQDFVGAASDTIPISSFNDAPKVENLKRLFAASYRDMPVTVMASSKASH